MSHNPDLRQQLAEAVALQNTQNHPEAITIFQSLLRQHDNPADPVRVLMWDGLGRSWHMLGELEQAEEAFTQSLTLLEQLFGTEHQHVAGGLQNLSRVCAARGAWQEACTLGSKGVSILQNTLGDNHPRLADALLNLSSCYYDGENFDKAETLLRQAQSIWESHLGADSVPVSTCLNNRGRILERCGKPAEGALLHQQAVDIRRRLLGDHPETAFSLGNWGAALADAEQWDKAAEALQEALDCYEKLGLEQEEAAHICRQNLHVCQNAKIRA